MPYPQHTSSFSKAPALDVGDTDEGEEEVGDAVAGR